MPDSLDLLEDGETLDLDDGGLDSEVDEVIEMNMQYSLLNHLTYEISVAHNLDGLYNTLETVPEMADEKAGGILWVLLTSGLFHTVKLGAESDWQYYHVRFCEATMSYYGHLS